MKKFSVWTYRLGPKIRQGEDSGGVVATTPPPQTEQKLTYFCNHEDDIQSYGNKFWYGVSSIKKFMTIQSKTTSQ